MWKKWYSTTTCNRSGKNMEEQRPLNGMDLILLMRMTNLRICNLSIAAMSFIANP
jgi:hypothetical protein